MRHRIKGRILSRTSSHRRSMYRNMAASLIRSVRVDEDDPRKPKVPGRIVTTTAKAKAVQPFVEKLVTLARKAVEHMDNAEQFATSAEKHTEEWRSWRESEQWNQWNQAMAPAVALRRRAFNILRDEEAVDVLFDELAERFENRSGGYTRIVRLSGVRLGDGGEEAILEFVGERDRVSTKAKAPVVTDTGTEDEATEGAAAGTTDVPTGETAEAEPDAEQQEQASAEEASSDEPEKKE